MQAPFAFDSDGNLVISAKMVEALTFGKLRGQQDMTQASSQEVIQAISAEIKKSDLHAGLQESIDAIRFDQINTDSKARAEADSALAEEIGRLWEKLGEKPPGEASSMSASKYQPEKIEITVDGGMSATGEIQLSDSCSVDGCPVQVTDETTVGEIKAAIAEKCYRLLKTLPAK